jgi:hypothetical protein
MKISVTREREYVPDWENNKDDPNPIVITHKAASAALSAKLIPKAVLRVTGSKGVEQAWETEITVDNEKLCRAMIIDIKNLEFDVDGKVFTVRNADGLFGEDVPAGLTGLVDEIGQYFQGLLSEKVVDTKN